MALNRKYYLPLDLAARAAKKEDLRTIAQSSREIKGRRTGYVELEVVSAH